MSNHDVTAMLAMVDYLRRRLVELGFVHAEKESAQPAQGEPAHDIISAWYLLR